MSSALITFRMNLNTEDCLVGDEGLDRVGMVGEARLECDPLVGHARDTVHVVSDAIEGAEFEHGDMTINLATETGDGPRQDMLEKRSVERNAVGDDCLGWGELLGRGDAGRKIDDARGLLSHAWSVGNRPSDDK